MARTLGLDIGDKRIGVSVSDPSGLLASPLGVFPRAAGEAERKIKQLAAQYDVGLIVAGMPYGPGGAESEQCGKIRSFCRRLARRVCVKLVFVDEYLSTAEAEELCSEGRGNLAAASLRDEIDAFAACVILQRFLNRSAVEPKQG